MVMFRTLLVVLFTSVVAYTVPVVAEHGINLFPTFFGDIAATGWPGQFNVDFLAMLTLSGLWLAWRHRFSPAGLALGVLGFFGGAPVLTAYLLYAHVSANGDIREALVGKERARAAAGS